MSFVRHPLPDDVCLQLGTCRYVLFRLLKQNDHSLGSLNNRNLFHMVLEAGRPQIKVLVNSVPREGLLAGLRVAVFLLDTHMAESKGRKQVFSSLFLKGH